MIILGILDILIALVFGIYGFFHIGFSDLILYAGLYLLIKGGMFIIPFNLVSALDVISGIVMINSLFFTMPIFIVILVSLFLFQKGAFSLWRLLL